MVLADKAPATGMCFSPVCGKAKITKAQELPVIFTPSKWYLVQKCGIHVED